MWDSIRWTIGSITTSRLDLTRRLSGVCRTRSVIQAGLVLCVSISCAVQHVNLNSREEKIAWRKDSDRFATVYCYQKCVKSQDLQMFNHSLGLALISCNILPSRTRPTSDSRCPQLHLLTFCGIDVSCDSPCHDLPRRAWACEKSKTSPKWSELVIINCLSQSECNWSISLGLGKSHPGARDDYWLLTHREWWCYLFKLCNATRHDTTTNAEYIRTSFRSIDDIACETKMNATTFHVLSGKPRQPCTETRWIIIKRLW